jgi:hypothetical protein
MRDVYRHQLIASLAARLPSAIAGFEYNEHVGDASRPLARPVLFSREDVDSLVSMSCSPRREGATASRRIAGGRITARLRVFREAVMALPGSTKISLQAKPTMRPNC